MANAMHILNFNQIHARITVDGNKTVDALITVYSDGAVCVKLEDGRTFDHEGNTPKAALLRDMADALYRADLELGY